MLSETLASVWPGWEIVGEIGHGAYGKVYKISRSNADSGEVEYQALKVVSIPLDEEAFDVFALGQTERDQKSVYYHSMAVKLAQEAAFMSDMRGNPYIVRYFGHAVIPQRGNALGWDVLIRMELLTPFKAHITAHGLMRQDVIKLGIDVCKALELCRERDVIHRDIKPENIFFSETGNYKLGDFGVAVNADKTLGGLSKKGTYTYMAPEIYNGKPYGPSVDLYSLGILLYQLINSGKEPFLPLNDYSYESRERALSRRMCCEPLPCPAGDKGNLAGIILKAAAPLPGDRYNSPTEMRMALEQALDSGDNVLLSPPRKNIFENQTGTGTKRVTPAAEAEMEEVDKPKKQANSHKAALVAACVALGLILLVGGFFAIRQGKEALQAQHEEASREEHDTGGTDESGNESVAAAPGGADMAGVKEPESVEIIVAPDTLMDGDTCRIEYKVLPEGAEASITWKSSNQQIAKVDENGLLTAYTAGVVTITAELDNGVTGKCGVNVISNKVTEYEGVNYSDVYDFNYYIKNEAVKGTYENDPSGALKHFVTEGISAGLQGIAQFNVLGYARANADLREKYGDRRQEYVMHYITNGKAEGRSGIGSKTMKDYKTIYNHVDHSDVYDYNYYIERYPYVYEMFGVDDEATLYYFLTTGMAEGQQGCEEFDPVSYAYEYADVRSPYYKSLDEYLMQGGYTYTAIYYDYINRGKEKGYHGTGCTEMKDFVTLYHGQDWSGYYDYNVYRENNPDIIPLVGADDQAALEHYVKYGYAEGRKACNYN